MSEEPGPKQAMVFIDGQNQFLSAKETFTSARTTGKSMFARDFFLAMDALTGQNGFGGSDGCAQRD